MSLKVFKAFISIFWRLKTECQVKYFFLVVARVVCGSRGVNKGKIDWWGVCIAKELKYTTQNLTSLSSFPLDQLHNITETCTGGAFTPGVCDCVCTADAFLNSAPILHLHSRFLKFQVPRKTGRLAVNKYEYVL